MTNTIIGIVAMAAAQDGRLCVDESKKSCKKCKSLVKTGFKCEICNRVSHPSCVEMLVNRKLAKYVNKDQSIINCCLGNRNEDDREISKVTPCGSELNTEVLYLKQLIIDKDNLISTKDELIKALLAQIDLLNEIKNSRNKPSAPSMSREKKARESTEAAPVPSSASKEKPNTPRTTKSDQNKCDLISKQDVAVALEQINAENKCAEHKNSVNNDEWQVKAPKKKKTHHKPFSGITGTGDVMDGAGGFSAYSRKAWFYVGKVQPGTGSEKISSYLKNKYPSVDVTVEKLQSHENAISESYKVGVDYSMLEKFNDPLNWPTGVLVKRFVFFRNK